SGVQGWPQNRHFRASVRARRYLLRMMAQARVQVIERRRLRSSTTSSPHTVQNPFTSSRCVIQVFSHIAQCFSSDTLGAVVAHFGTTIFGVVIAVADSTNSTITQRLRVCDLPE